MIVPYAINKAALWKMPIEYRRELATQLARRLRLGRMEADPQRVFNWDAYPKVRMFLDECIADCDAQLRQLFLAIADTGKATH